MKMAVGLTVVAFLALPALAVDWAGEYTWTATHEEQTAYEQALTNAAQSANPLIRTVVRKRLAAGSVPYPGVRFAVTNGGVIFDRVPGARPVTASLDSLPVEWEREDGKKYQVIFTKENEGMKQTFTNEDGVRENLFRWSADGSNLSMTVTINASVIKVPLAYTLTFVRKP